MWSLDFLLDRAPLADAAAALWQANDDGRIEAYVSVITPVNVFYIARKLKGAATARQLVESLLAAVPGVRAGPRHATIGLGVANKGLRRRRASGQRTS